MSGPSDDRPAGRTQAATRLGVVSRTGFARETLLLAFAGEFDLVPIDLGSGTRSNGRGPVIPISS